MANEPVVEAKNLFIRRWGEMGASWGISRTMAEVHALLYLSSEPLCTDQVMEDLSISRGNASMNLRELEHWALVQRIHRRGDRKEYFQAEQDVWQMFETIMRERRRREVLPIMETIERCMAMIGPDKKKPSKQEGNAAAEYRKKYADILEFCELMNTLFNLMSRTGRTRAGSLARKLGKLIAK